MENIVTISQIAKELGVSYHVARNKLRRNEEAKKYRKKLGHTVVYDEAVMEIIKCDQ